MLEILWNLRGEEREILEAAMDIFNHNNTVVHSIVMLIFSFLYRITFSSTQHSIPLVLVISAVDVL